MQVPADVAAAELERIKEAHDGSLTPQQVVDESRPKRAPLHKAFEWDDAVAGELWRVDQARRIISGVRVVEEDGEDQQPKILYAAVKNDEEEHVYVDRSRLQSDEDLRLQALRSAIRLVKGVQERVRQLDELKGLNRAIDSELRKVEKRIPKPVKAG
jgi:hypothetical protein